MLGASVDQLEGLYRDRYSHFVRVATALLRSEEQAFDVVQEAFVSAIRDRRSYRREGPLEAWVWRIVVNTARKTLGQRSRQPASARPGAEHEPEPGPVREAILALPERQRLVLFLHYYADLDYRSIAAALEISSGTVAATLSAARASVRHSLEEVRS